MDRQLYQLMISQLKDDGFPTIAHALSDATMIPSPVGIPSNRLNALVQLGQSVVGNQIIDTTMMDNNTTESFDITMAGINLDQPSIQKNSIPNFETSYITTHKQACRVARFSPDGKLIATGSEDNSIKLLSVEKVKLLKQYNSESGLDKSSAPHPVIKTYYHHTERVNDIDFHPFQPFFCSTSDDNTIQFYDVRSGKRSFKVLTETNNPNSLHFHPSGDFLLVGSTHPMIRVYDINTGTGFTSIRPSDHHHGSVNQIRYSLDGSFYVSCSSDGYIKIWDTVTNLCEKVIANAHNGCDVTSVKISKSGRYLLSAGTDSMVKLWDVSTGKQVSSYSHHSCGNDRFNAEFGHNEEYIVCSDGSSGIIYNTRTTEVEHRLKGHNNTVLWTAASSTEPAIITCSEDYRARFWSV